MSLLIRFSLIIIINYITKKNNRKLVKNSDNQIEIIEISNQMNRSQKYVQLTQGRVLPGIHIKLKYQKNII